MMQLFERSRKQWIGFLAISIAVLFLSSPAIAQLTDPFPGEAWHFVYDSGYGHDVGSGVALDSNQNVIIAGYRNSGSTDAVDAYAVKLDNKGTFLCEREVKGPQSPNQVSFTDSFTSVAVDSQNNIILAGQISGNWYGAEGYHNAMYLNKYNGNCNPVWSQPVIYHEINFGDSAWQEAHSVVLDSSDNIFPTGRVFGAWDSPPGNILESEWATWKYNSSGQLQAGFPVYYNYSQFHYIADLSYDIALDGFGNMIVVGYRGVSGTDGGIYNDLDWHVRKYDPTGALLWEHTYGGSANLYDSAYRVAVDTQNNPIVVGYVNKGTDNSTNANFDWQVIKYAADGVGGVGQVLWTYTYESITGTSEASYAVAVDSNDNVIVGGTKKVDATTIHGRLVLLEGTSGNILGERIITDPLNVVPVRLAYQDGTIAIGGYIWDPAGSNNDMYAALLQNTAEPISPIAPADGTTFDTCSYFDPPTFEWTLNQTFGKLELQFFTSANQTKPTKVKLKDPAATQLTIPAKTWKKILKLPGLSGGEINWKLVGTNKGQPVVQSDVYTMTISAPEPAGKPDIDPLTHTATWGNSCGTKFKAYFSADIAFSKSKKLSFKYQGSDNPDDLFSITLPDKTWASLVKLVEGVVQPRIYFYVESWDIIKRYQKTDVAYIDLDI